MNKFLYYLLNLLYCLRKYYNNIFNNLFVYIYRIYLIYTQQQHEVGRNKQNELPYVSCDGIFSWHKYFLHWWPAGTLLVTY